MNEKAIGAKLVGAGVAGMLLLTMLITGLSATAEGTPPEEVKCDTPEEQKFYTAVALSSVGFSVNDLRTEGHFDTSLAGATDAGSGRFSPQTITTKDQLLTFLNSGTPAANAMVASLRAGMSEADFARAAFGHGWVGIQFLNPIVFEGNTTFNGSVSPASYRTVANGDIWWFYVGEDCAVYANVGVRGPCGNLELAPPAPRGKPAPKPTGEPMPPPEKRPHMPDGPPGSPTTTSPPTTHKPPPTTSPPTTQPPPPTTLQPKEPVPVPGPGGPDSPGAGTQESGPDTPEQHDWNDCQATGYCNGTEPQTPITAPPPTNPPPEVSNPEDSSTSNETSSDIVGGP